jgi:hypothetical protein
MKKIVAILSLALLIVQCSIDDTNSANDDTSGDDGGGGGSATSFVINVIGEYFGSEGGHLYLSLPNGTILADGALSNGNTTSLTAEFDINEQYDATIVYSFGPLYNVFTFEDVRPGVYNLRSSPSLNPNNEELTITLTNVGVNLDLQILSSTQYLNLDANNENGGTYILSGALPSIPADYFVSFKKPNEALPRYFWRQNLVGGFTETVDYSSLPYANSLKITQFPENQGLTLSIEGVKTVRPGVGHSLQNTTVHDGASSNELFYDSSIFDFYRFSSSFRVGDAFYYYSTTAANIPSEVTTPNLNLEITSSNMGSFSMSTTGTYDTFETFYVDDIAGVTIFYRIIGKAAPNVSFTKATLFNRIFADNTQINTGVMKFSRASIQNSSGTDSYNEIIKSLLDPGTSTSTFATTDAVTKLE